MPEFVDHATGGYTVKPDGSLEPNYANSYELSMSGEKMLVYKDGILKLHRFIYEQMKSVKLTPKGENLTIQTSLGPIFLKGVKSIQPLK
jgi:hypothetical protein